MSLVVPKGWRIEELGSLVVDGPTNGYSPPAAPDARGTRSLRLSATTQGRLILNSDTIKLLHETVPEDSWAWLEPGDLLVQRSNTADLVGTAAIFDGPPRSFIYPDLMMRLRFADEATTRWVWRYMNSSAGRGFFSVMAAGAAGSMPKISGTKLRSMPIPLPSLSEQRRIADILDKADAVRRKRKEAIALTEELLRSTFLDMFGDPVMNPKGWPVKPLRELLAAPLRNGLSPASGGTFEAQVLTLSAITRGQFDAAAFKSGTFAVEPWEDVRVDARDFLICRGNGNVSLVGSAAFPRDSMKNMVFPDTMIAARVDQARVCPAFLNTIWKSGLIRRQIEAGARTTNGTFKINQTVVEGIELVVPPPAKQKVFADLEARVAKSIANQRAALERGEDLFNSLVHRAFRGELTKSSKAPTAQRELFKEGSRI